MTAESDDLTARLKRARSAWSAMHRRCSDPARRDWQHYGGAGIRVSPRWAEFDAFLADMGLPPGPNSWLGRLDTRGHFVRENCAWTTPQEQQRRRAYCRRIPGQDGRAVTAAEAARNPSMPTRNTVLRRWSAGLPLTNRVAKLYRASLWVTWAGETLPVPEWARRLGISRGALRARLRRGMQLEQAMRGPIRRHAKAARDDA